MGACPLNPHYQLVNLASVPACLPAIADWQHRQWLSSRPLMASPQLNKADETRALNERISQLRLHLAASLIPVTFVMLYRREPVGSVSLVSYRATDAIHASVWLTNMFVLAEHRQQGLAQALLHRAEDYARSIQVPSLNLYAKSARDFYLKRHWRTVNSVEINSVRVDVLARYLA